MRSEPNSIPTEYDLEIESISKNAGIAALGISFMTIMAFINNVLITRTLGADSYGLFVLANSIFAFILIIPQLGFNSTIIRFVSYYRGKGEQAKVKGTILYGLKLLLVVSLVVTLLSIAANKSISENLFGRPELKPLLRILMLSLPFVVLAMLFNAALNGLKLIKYQVIATNILTPAIFFLLILIVFTTGSGVKGLILMMLVLVLLTAIISFWFLTKHYFRGVRHLKADVEIKPLIRFATPNYLMQFLSSAIGSAPIFFIGYLYSNSDIGIFNVGFKVAMLVSLSMSAFRLIFSPTISGLFAQGNKMLISRLYKTITKWIFIIALVTFSLIVLHAKTVLGVFGSEFTGGVWILIIVMTGELVNAGAGLAGDIIIMSGRPKVELLISGICIIVLTCLCFFLIPIHGINGAAIAYAVSMCLVNILRLLWLYFAEKIHPYNISFLKPLLASAIAFASVYYIQKMISNGGNAESLLGIPFFLLLFFVLLWLLKINDEDMFIFRMINNRLRKRENLRK